MQRVRLINPGDLPSGGVIRADQVRALMDASEIRARAEEWRRAQNEAHAARLEAALNEAREKAYAEGVAELLSAAAAYRAAVEKVEAKLVGFLRECLTRVFDSRPAEDVLKATITPVLRGVSMEDDVTIVINPARAGAIEAALLAAGEATGSARIAVEIDSAMPVEDCRIYTDSEVINVGVPLVIERLIGALRNHLHAPRAQAEKNRGGADHA